MVFPDSKEIAKINKMILKAKSLIAKHFIGTPYHEQVEIYSTSVNKHGIDMVMSVLSTLYENLKEDYESLKKKQSISLKYDKIIEDINITDKIYEEVIAEINGTYYNYFFRSMYIIVRKLLENLLYDCLRAYYGGQNVKKYFNINKSQHQGFGTLIDNFNDMIKETRFKTDVGDVEQRFIDLLKEFQEKGNKHAHSLFDLPHQDFIEERKDKINNLIKKLDWALQKL